MSLLKDLMVDTKSAWIDYPGIKGFEVEIAHLSRAQSIALRKKCTITKFDRKTKQPEETLDEDKFIAEFTKLTIKNWKGLTLEGLESLLPIDRQGKPGDTPVPYSQEDAALLIEHSSEFDKWVNDQVYDLENFRSGSENTAVGKTE